MLWFGLVLSFVIFSFGFVLLYGAPYLPTLSPQQRTALELLDLKPGQTLIELGSGDGRMLAAAAEQGIKAIGYELNPLLVVYSMVTLRRYRGLVKVKWANFWQQPLPECDGIYVFLLDRYMTRLHKKVVQEIGSSVKLVSFAFQLPETKHLTERNGLYLYKIHNKKIDKIQDRQALL